MIYVIIGYIIALLVDLMPLLRKKQPRMLAAFLCFFIVSFAVALLQTANVKLPSPMIIVGEFMKQIGLSY